MNEESIFQAALAKATPDECAAYLDAACAGDADLRRNVEGLLQAHANAGRFLRDPNSVEPENTTESLAPPETVATTIGRYKLLEEIGEGGMGTVWMAEQTRPVERLVALKLVKSGMDSRQVLARFDAERQALALMDHPNIAKVFDAGTNETGRPYFVMELVKGVPITKFCDERRLTPRQRLELFVPVCQAIQHAHQKGVIHRDVKPSNVLVALYDDKPVPKVIDFGIAKAAGRPLTEQTLHTGFGGVVGTPEYMSPEQASFNQLDVDTRSDVYSLGVVLYELLAGSPPFTRQDLEKAGMLEMLRVIREQEPSRPSTKLSTADALPTLAANRGTEPARLTRLMRGELDWIVMKALEKDRGRRYETAASFAQDFQRYLADEPVHACPPSTPYRLRKFARRNKAALGTISLVTAALVGGVVAATWGLIRADAARRDEAEQRTLADDRRIEAEAQWKRADEEKRRADQNYARARKAVQDYLTATAADPRLQAADLSALRKSLLATAIPFYEEFVMQRSDDPDVEAERGRAYGELAHVRREMGETDKALADSRMAQEIFARLGKRQPADPSHMANVAVALGQQGLMLRDLGRHAEAVQAHRVALGIRTRLTDEFAHVPIYRSELASTLQHLSSLLADLGEADEARAIQQRALELSRQLVADFPNDPDHRAMLAANHGNLGSRFSEMGRWEAAETHYSEARDLFRKLAADHPHDAQRQNDLAVHLLMVGGWFLDRGQLDQAEAAYREAMRTWEKLAGDFPSLPGHRHSLAQACNNLGVVLDQSKRHAEAETAHRKALAIREKLTADFSTVPEYRARLAGSLQNLGLLLRGQGKAPEAREAFERSVPIWRKLVAEFPDVPAYRTGLGGAYVNLGALVVDVDPEAALAWCDQAIAALGPALARDGERATTREYLGKAHMVRAHAFTRLDRTADAKKEWERARAINSSLVPAKVGESWPNPAAAEFVNRGVAHSRKGELDQAIAAYTQAITLEPKLAVAYRNRGRDYAAQGKHDLAIADFTASIRLEPKNADAWCDRGQALAQKGDHAAALADWAEALRLNPKHPLVRRHRGQLYVAQGKFDEAIADFTQAITLQPRDAEAYVRRGACFSEKGQHDRSIADFTEAIRLNPKHVAALLGRAMDLDETGQHARAVEDCTAVIRLEADNALAYALRALAYRSLGDVAKAEADERKAQELKGTGKR